MKILHTRECCRLLCGELRPLRWISLAIIVSVGILVVPARAQSQRNELFDTQRITTDIKRRFHLSSREVKQIEPVIAQENKKVAKIYVRFCGDEPEYSPRVWRQVVDDRMSFESTLGGAVLTVKQKEAVRSARAKMEKRILDYLIVDYVTFLSQFLELTEFEYNDVNTIFESESEKKRHLVIDHLDNPALLAKEIDRVSDETEFRLRSVLTPDQWRQYKELENTQDLVA
jgi:hypothetical protein